MHTQTLTIITRVVQQIWGHLQLITLTKPPQQHLKDQTGSAQDRNLWKKLIRASPNQHSSI